MCLRLVFLLALRVPAWLRLWRRSAAWKDAEILLLRHQVALLERRSATGPKPTWADRALFAVPATASASHGRPACAADGSRQRELGLPALRRGAGRLNLRRTSSRQTPLFAQRRRLTPSERSLLGDLRVGHPKATGHGRDTQFQILTVAGRRYAVGEYGAHFYEEGIEVFMAVELSAGGVAHFTIHTAWAMRHPRAIDVFFDPELAPEADPARTVDATAAEANRGELEPDERERFAPLELVRADHPELIPPLPISLTGGFASTVDHISARFVPARPLQADGIRFCPRRRRAGQKSVPGRPDRPDGRYRRRAHAGESHLRAACSRLRRAAVCATQSEVVSRTGGHRARIVDQ
jgi:hypothetical protein